MMMTQLSVTNVAFYLAYAIFGLCVILCEGEPFAALPETDGNVESSGSAVVHRFLNSSKTEEPHIVAFTRNTTISTSFDNSFSKENTTMVPTETRVKEVLDLPDIIETKNSKDSVNIGSIGKNTSFRSKTSNLTSKDTSNGSNTPVVNNSIAAIRESQSSTNLANNSNDNSSLPASSADKPIHDSMENEMRHNDSVTQKNISLIATIETTSSSPVSNISSSNDLIENGNEILDGKDTEIPKKSATTETAVEIKVDINSSRTTPPNSAEDPEKSGSGSLDSVNEMKKEIQTSGNPSKLSSSKAPTFSPSVISREYHPSTVGSGSAATDDNKEPGEVDSDEYSEKENTHDDYFDSENSKADLEQEDSADGEIYDENGLDTSNSKEEEPKAASDNPVEKYDDDDMDITWEVMNYSKKALIGLLATCLACGVYVGLQKLKDNQNIYEPIPTTGSEFNAMNIRKKGANGIPITPDVIRIG